MSATLAGLAACWYFWAPPVLVVVTLLYFDHRRGRINPSGRCVCIHPKAMHEHWHPGTDCGKCDCPEYVPAVELVRCRQLPHMLTLDGDLITSGPEFSAVAMDELIDELRRES